MTRRAWVRLDNASNIFLAARQPIGWVVAAAVTALVLSAREMGLGEGKQVGITLDGRVISAPTINSAILGGGTEITGSFNVNGIDATREIRAQSVTRLS